MVKCKIKYMKIRDLVVNVLNQDFLRVRFCQIKMFSHLCSTFHWYAFGASREGK